jgi:hypothetical protein
MIREREISTDRPSLRPDLAAVLLLVLVTITAPAFLEDDAAFFNYQANVTGASPLFYYYGYVSFIAAPLAFALSGLPFVIQALAYRAVALVALLILYRELVRFFSIGARESEARLLTLATLLLARGVDDNIWTNLTYAIWPAFFAAALYVIRTNISKARYSRAGLGGIVLAAMSNPLGLLLVPLLAAYARINRAAAGQNAALAAALAAGHLLIYLRSPDAAVVTTDPVEIARLFINGYRTEFKLNTLVVALSLPLLVGALIWDRRRRPPVFDRAVLWPWAFLGIASVATYVVSDRFLHLEGGFRPQHALTVMLAALIILGRAITRLDHQWLRGVLFGLLMGLAGATMASEWYFHLRGPLEYALLKYRFLMVADSFRDSCREGDTMLFEDDSSSAIVMCRPAAFAIGRHSFLTVVPSIGVPDEPTNDPRERPMIIVGQPLFWSYRR